MRPCVRPVREWAADRYSHTAGTPNAPATSGDDTVSALMANVVLDDLNDLSHNEMLSNAKCGSCRRRRCACSGRPLTSLRPRSDFMIDESNVEFFHGDQRRLTRTVIRHDLQQWVAWRLSDMVCVCRGCLLAAAVLTLCCASGCV